jgi:hypothetical protein
MSKREDFARDMIMSGITGDELDTLMKKFDSANPVKPAAPKTTDTPKAPKDYSGFMGGLKAIKDIVTDPKSRGANFENDFVSGFLGTDPKKQYSKGIQGAVEMGADAGNRLSKKLEAPTDNGILNHIYNISLMGLPQLQSNYTRTSNMGKGTTGKEKLIGAGTKIAENAMYGLPGFKPLMNAPIIREGLGAVLPVATSIAMDIGDPTKRDLSGFEKIDPTRLAIAGGLGIVGGGVGINRANAAAQARAEAGNQFPGFLKAVNRDIDNSLGMSEKYGVNRVDLERLLDLATGANPVKIDGKVVPHVAGTVDDLVQANAGKFSALFPGMKESLRHVMNYGPKKVAEGVGKKRTVTALNEFFNPVKQKFNEATAAGETWLAQNPEKGRVYFDAPKIRLGGAEGETDPMFQQMFGVSRIPEVRVTSALENKLPLIAQMADATANMYPGISPKAREDKILKILTNLSRDEAEKAIKEGVDDEIYRSITNSPKPFDKKIKTIKAGTGDVDFWPGASDDLIASRTEKANTFTPVDYPNYSHAMNREIGYDGRSPDFTRNEQAYLASKKVLKEELMKNPGYKNIMKNPMTIESGDFEPEALQADEMYGRLKTIGSMIKDQKALRAPMRQRLWKPTLTEPTRHVYMAVDNEYSDPFLQSLKAWSDANKLSAPNTGIQRDSENNTDFIDFFKKF